MPTEAVDGGQIPVVGLWAAILCKPKQRFVLMTGPKFVWKVRNSNQLSFQLF